LLQLEVFSLPTYFCLVRCARVALFKVAHLTTSDGVEDETIHGGKVHHAMHGSVVHGPVRLACSVLQESVTVQ